MSDGIGPGPIVQPEVVQATTRFHQLILNMLAPQSELVFDDATAFDTPNHMLNPHTDTADALMLRFLLSPQFAAARFFLWLCDANSGNGKALKAQILIQPTVGGKGVLLLIRHRFIMPRPFIGGAEKPNATIVPNQEQVFDRMLLLLPAGVEALFIRVGRAVDRAFGAIMKKKALDLLRSDRHWCRRARSAMGDSSWSPRHDSGRGGGDESMCLHSMVIDQRVARATFGSALVSDTPE